jgi:dihydrofolate reductase
MNMMMSLDGFVAGPEQSEENPFGIGGMRLNEWLLPLEVFREMQGEEGGEVNASTSIVQGWMDNIGATVMGRNMFGGGPGPWGTDPWKASSPRAGLLDEMLISVVPVLLGSGARLFQDLGSDLPKLEQTQAVEAPGVTHIRYRVLK